MKPPAGPGWGDAEPTGPNLATDQEILRRLDDLLALCVQRFRDDREHRGAIDALVEQLRRAEAGPFREYVQPFVLGTALVIDRLDRYTGGDRDLAVSVRDELLDVLQRYGVTQVPVHGQFDATQHDAVERGADPSAPSGAILAVLRRGFAHGSWVFRPARVVVNALPSS
jgi:hypothetical protein